MRKTIIFLVFVTIASSILDLIPPYLGKQVFDKGVMKNNIDSIVFFGLLTLGTYLLIFSTKFSGQVLFSIASNRFTLNLKKNILKRLSILPTEFFDKQRSGYLVNRINEADGISTVFSPTIFQFITGIIESIGALIIIINIDGQLVLLLVPFIPVLFFITTWMSKKLRTSIAVLKESSAITISGLQEIVTGINEIKQNDIESKKINHTIDQYKELTLKRIKQSLLVAGGLGSIGLITSLFSITVMIFIGILITNGQLTIGDYVALTGYSIKVITPIQSFGNLSLIFQPVIVSIQRLGVFFNTDTEQEIWGDREAYSLNGDIEFSHVAFGYDTSSSLVMRDCSFSISHGESVSIYGNNGIGKSTIFKLILGMYNNYKGNILIDKRELHEYSIFSLRKRIGIVSQNTFLFKGSLLDNIRISSPSIPEYRIKEVLKISGCEIIFGDNVANIQVEEYGKNLSGGQKQAAAIARCLLRDPDILLFDEATIHLDEVSSKIVLDAFINVFKDKTRIIITHDYTIAGLVDRILFLNDGMIQEAQLSELSQ